MVRVTLTDEEYNLFYTAILRYKSDAIQYGNIALRDRIDKLMSNINDKVERIES